MPILEQFPELLQALRGDMTPKFLATRSGDGVPNVVPVISIRPADDQPDTLFFGNFLLRKTIKNLERDPRVGILVVTPELVGWILKGDFVEFQRTGPYVDQQMSGPLLRYNAYTGIRNAGIIRVSSVENVFALSRQQVAADYFIARLRAFVPFRRAAGGAVLPLPVRNEFARRVAVKVLAWTGVDGYPSVAPALSLQPDGATRLTCCPNSHLPRPTPGAMVAANILTFEAISYQVKGTWSGGSRTGTIAVQEAYAGGPPYPGGRVV